MIRRLLKQEKKEQDNPSPLPEGEQAPDFAIESDSGKLVSLSDLRGRPVVLIFYPRDNTSVCSSQLILYNEAYQLFEEHDAQLVGISIDNHASHQAFADSLGLRFPLLSDDNPLGATASAYGVFNEGDRVAERALFVLDADGVIRWRHVSPRGVNPGADGILNALKSLEEDGT